MRKIAIGFIITCLIVAVVVAVIQIKSSFIPKLTDYETQKHYAQKLYWKVAATGEAAVFMPTPTAGKLTYFLYYIPANKNALNAYLYLIKQYPEKANDDVDVLSHLGDLYFNLQKYDKALAMNQKQLEVFKRKYFDKEAYPEKAGLTSDQVKIAEYKYVVGVHGAIAACYNAMKQYDNGLKEYEKAISLLPETEGLNKWDRRDIFNTQIIHLGKLLKVIYKDYNRAIVIYEMMKNNLHDDMSITAAEILIGDTYLAMGDIDKAQKKYQEVIDIYKPDKRGTFDTAERRLESIKKQEMIVGSDGVVYEFKDGKVKVRY